MGAKRVRILVEPPVDSRHGMYKNRVIEVLALKPRTETPPGFWVMGDLGKPVLLMEYEAFDYPEGWS